MDNVASRQTARIPDRQQATSRKQQAAITRSKIRQRPAWQENADVAQYVLFLTPDMSLHIRNYCPKP
ncbi:hypothetical protein L596_025684 [Steinernema carpocapsae]|uniref:Uncharacterized protein n=1 Tax=Steinernema carpocapsae TaxID=34508 RepID=A0A4U5M8I6_STECR|nr:hypothetical protein L596_025684 [Steinernema carpocapsae]